MNGAGFAAEGVLVRIWHKLGGVQKVTVGVFLGNWFVGSNERMGKPSLKMHLKGNLKSS